MTEKYEVGYYTHSGYRKSLGYCNSLERAKVWRGKIVDDIIRSRGDGWDVLNIYNNLRIQEVKDNTIRISGSSCWHRKKDVYVVYYIPLKNLDDFIKKEDE